MYPVDWSFLNCLLTWCNRKNDNMISTINGSSVFQGIHFYDFINFHSVQDRILTFCERIWRICHRYNPLYSCPMIFIYTDYFQQTTRVDRYKTMTTYRWWQGQHPYMTLGYKTIYPPRHQFALKYLPISLWGPEWGNDPGQWRWWESPSTAVGKDPVKKASCVISQTQYIVESKFNQNNNEHLFIHNNNDIIVKMKILFFPQKMYKTEDTSRIVCMCFSNRIGLHNENIGQAACRGCHPPLTIQCHFQGVITITRP